MSFLIISHVVHKNSDGKLFAYGPYVREMNLWLKYTDTVAIVSPTVNQKASEINLSYSHKNIKHHRIPNIQFTSFGSSILSIIKLPYIIFMLFKACLKADHIHLRCPGNIGLLGCLVQIFFPSKAKTAKYAGNWDPKANQPLSYRLQKLILSNTFLTKNMKVLVYGDWGKQSKNIAPFFTASYSEVEKEHDVDKNLKSHVKLLFVGTLSKGKRPLLTVQVLEDLLRQGFKASLGVYGDGEERDQLETYIKTKDLSEDVILYGNRDKETIKEAFKQSHFLIFISKSEGWPKVVAEAMFWKCLPISSSVSCIPEMLDHGNRGSIVQPKLQNIVDEILFYIRNESIYKTKVNVAYDWSREFTLEKFDDEIKKLIIEN